MVQQQTKKSKLIIRMKDAEEQSVQWWFQQAGAKAHMQLKIKALALNHMEQGGRWSLVGKMVLIPLGKCSDNKMGEQIARGKKTAEKLEKNFHPKIHSSQVSSYSLPGCNTKYRLRNSLFNSVKMPFSEWPFFWGFFVIFKVVWLNGVGNREKLSSWMNT